MQEQLILVILPAKIWLTLIRKGSIMVVHAE